MSDAEVLTLALALWTGGCIGSFVNVLAHRLPGLRHAGPLEILRGLSSPPSACPKCGTRIPAYLNLPVLGYLFAGGRCRHCRQAISIRYPMVEAGFAVATGALAAALGLHWTLAPALVILWTLMAALVVKCHPANPGGSPATHR